MGVVGQLGGQVILARTLGSVPVGIIGVSLSWIRIAGNTIGLGQPTFVLREGSVLWERRRGPASSDLRLRSIRLLGRMGLGVLVLGVVVAFGPWLEESPYRVVALPTAVGITAFGLNRLAVEAVKALDRPIRSVTLEFASPAILNMLFVAALWGTGRLTVVSAAWALAAGFGLSALAGLNVWRRQVSELNPRGREPGGERVPHLQVPDRLGLTVATGILPVFVAAPPILLAAVSSPADVGILVIVMRLGSLPTIGLSGLAAAYGPQLARAARRGDPRECRRLIRRTQVASLAIYGALGLPVIIAPRHALALFGPEFLPAAAALRGLLIAQIAMAGSGLSSLYLLVSGGQSRELASTAVWFMVGGGIILLFGSHGYVVAVASYAAAQVGRHLTSHVLAWVSAGRSDD